MPGTISLLRMSWISVGWFVAWGNKIRFVSNRAISKAIKKSSKEDLWSQSLAPKGWRKDWGRHDRIEWWILNGLINSPEFRFELCWVNTPLWVPADATCIFSVLIKIQQKMSKNIMNVDRCVYILMHICTNWRLTVLNIFYIYHTKCSMSAFEMFSRFVFTLISCQTFRLASHTLFLRLGLPVCNCFINQSSRRCKVKMRKKWGKKNNNTVQWFCSIVTALPGWRF